MKNIRLILLSLILASTASARVANNAYVMPPSGSNLPTWGKINLSSSNAVTGALPSLFGGLGIDASSSTGAVLDTAGTISVGTTPPTSGGTGLSTYTLGDMIYASAANTLNKLSGVTSATLSILTQIGTGSASNPPQWQSASSVGLVPSGLVAPFAGSTAPTGWLLCDGSAVSRSTYSILYAAIGINYGAGDGSTTFNLPNTSGIFIKGSGTQTIAGISYTGAFSLLQNDQMQSHIHFLYGTHVSVTGTGSVTAPSDNGTGSPSNSYSGTPISDGTNGTPRIGADTHPANVSMNYIIKI